MIRKILLDASKLDTATVHAYGTLGTGFSFYAPQLNGGVYINIGSQYPATTTIKTYFKYTVL